MPATSERLDSATRTVRDVLTKAGLDPAPFDNGRGYFVAFQTDGPDVVGLAYVLDEERFVFYLQAQRPVPEKRRDAVAQFITRANFGLSLGNYEMNYDDGTVRYKTSVDFAGRRLQDWMVKHTVLTNMETVEVYQRWLEKVMDGADPEKAAAEADAQDDVVGN
jgi:Putative bacterial sensory transduction regulator